MNFGMTVMKEIGAQRLTSLYDKLRSEPNIIVNGFRNVGIIAAIQAARDGTLADSPLPTDCADEDHFADIMEN